MKEKVLSGSGGGGGGDNGLWSLEKALQDTCEYKHSMKRFPVTFWNSKTLRRERKLKNSGTCRSVVGHRTAMRNSKYQVSDVCYYKVIYENEGILKTILKILVIY